MRETCSGVLSELRRGVYEESVMKRITVLFLVAAVAVTFASVTEGSIIPGDPGMKWETSFRGFAGLELNSGVFELRSLLHTDSGHIPQGIPPSYPDEFQSGQDGDLFLPPGSSEFEEAKWKTVMLTYGLELIAVHDNTVSAGKPSHVLLEGGTLPTTWEELSAIAGPNDIFYFGPVDGGAGATIYEDVASNNASLAVLDNAIEPSYGFTHSGAGFDGLDTAGDEITIDPTVDIAAVNVKFEDLSGLDVTGDSLGLYAPAGTVYAQAIGGLSTVDSYSILTVDESNPGTQADRILRDGMQKTLANSSGGVTTVVGDFVPQTEAFIRSPVEEDTAFIAFSDPMEFCTTPEPASVIIWSVLLGAVALSMRIARRRAR